MAGLFKDWDPHMSATDEEGLVDSSLHELDAKSNVVRLRGTSAKPEPIGEVHEGLVTTLEGEPGIFLKVGPEAYLACGALVMHLWEGKRIRVTVDVICDADALEMPQMKEAA